MNQLIELVAKLYAQGARATEENISPDIESFIVEQEKLIAETMNQLNISLPYID